MNTPIFDKLADEYCYDTLVGWAFEDGPCPAHDRNLISGPCCCDRPWSDAWMELCDALRATDPQWDPPTRAWEVIKAALKRRPFSNP